MQVQAAPPAGKRQQTHQAVHFDLNPEPIMPAKQPTSKKRTKAEKKRLRKAQQAVFCWYCEREFEDAKVLLQHQKAKHFRCPHCPRRLNTAGGLAVHIDQVHKLPTDRIENAMPGRDTFDVEIYGMEGVPANDLADWKRRKAEAMGIEPEAQKRKRPKIYLGVISPEELRSQLQQHRALMNGISAGILSRPAGPPFGAAPPTIPTSAPSVPPPGLFAASSAPMPPPPGFPMMPPHPGMPFPPPGMSLPPMPHGMLPPGMPFPPPPGMLPPGMPPPPGMLPLPGLGMMPGAPPFAPPGAPSMTTPLAPPTGSQTATPGEAGSAATIPSTPAQPYKIVNSQVTLKPGQVLVYGDNEVSLEEKRARQPRYQAPIAIPDMRLGLPTR
ncbi:uncharacterized protein PGTG_21567 [Puccinia graminis f. sp. tritici CRL 75-36-700-3]|uniref:C2H2-type domain-containing protein n=2 Tax=Puccinia graminis f. sp. tritici TaxID=56615 RepID=H6QRZ9_PUCGT|nr:uncharacterized protein PGTG_21567 [Puccinia graminis f. sp. tritici CRL 75-36-700-3]EHS63434.1 hypothetical protein PGTG_21567 [Puccinia graminis f. sp. tritici CRL 75-36-700-3]